MNITNTNYWEMLKRMKPKYWFVDFDCTLVDSLTPVVEKMNLDHNTNLEPKDILSWNFREIKEDLSDYYIEEEIFASPYVFERMKFYDGVENFLKKNRENIVIITKGTPNNISKKIDWLKEKGYGDIKIIGLPLNISKKFINMSCKDMSGEDKDNFTVFIDDSTNNLLDSNADIKIQFNALNNVTEWNKDWEGLVFNSWN